MIHILRAILLLYSSYILEQKPNADKKKHQKTLSYLCPTNSNAKHQI